MIKVLDYFKQFGIFKSLQKFGVFKNLISRVDVIFEPQYKFLEIQKEEIRKLEQSFENEKNEIKKHKQLLQGGELCVADRVPIVDSMLGAGSFGTIYTLDSFPHLSAFQITHTANKYVMKVLKPVPLNINIIYKQPRDLRETAWDNVTFETLFDINFSNYLNQNITEEQFEQHRVYTLKHFRKHIQEINLMKQLANDRIAAKIASIWYSSFSNWDNEGIPIQNGYRTTFMYILEQGDPVDNYIKMTYYKPSSNQITVADGRRTLRDIPYRITSLRLGEDIFSKVDKLSENITKLIEKLYDNGYINTDMKPSNMIVVERESEDGGDDAAPRSNKRQKRSVEMPMLIDCGDPEFVFNIETLFELFRNREPSIQEEKIRDLLIFLQQFIFYEYIKTFVDTNNLQPKTRVNQDYLNALNPTEMPSLQFIPSYLEKLNPNDLTLLFNVILNDNTDLGLTLKHYSYDYKYIKSLHPSTPDIQIFLNITSNIPKIKNWYKRGKVGNSVLSYVLTSI